MPVIRADRHESVDVRGEDHGATTSLILSRSEPGDGPRLHRHPYDETWVVITGDITFVAGEDEMQAGPGDIVIVPPNTPHKFINNGPERCDLVCIHASPRMITEWLE